jgi:hypothetical protein
MNKEAIIMALNAWADDLENGRRVWIPAETLRKAAKALIAPQKAVTGDELYRLGAGRGFDGMGPHDCFHAGISAAEKYHGIKD